MPKMNLLPIGYAFGKHGELASLTIGGCQFASAKGTNLFLARLRDLVGNPVELAASDFQKVTCSTLAIIRKSTFP